MRAITMKTLMKGLGTLVLAVALAACGSGLGSTGSTSSSGSGSSGTGALSMGNGSGATFVKGVLGIASGMLSAGGSTSVTATIVDSSGNLYNQSVTVSFNSPCISAGLATIVDSSTGSAGSATAASGTAIATYTAKGCSGKDTITATATVGTATLTATGTVTVAAASLGSIVFDKASPPIISLKGMGGSGSQETSTVSFTVFDSVGGVQSGANVTFSLVSHTGGVTLSQSSAKSDANGDVQTIVQAGTHAGPVVVKAEAVASGVTIFTSSSGLAIQGGIPSQDFFSLSVSNYNPEGWDIDNNTSTITASLADRFGNPVPDHTAVSFIESDYEFGAGGRVQGSCETSGGICTVTWSSQDPRPQTIAKNQHVGFAYILAYTQGEESFTDQNGDGVFDDDAGVAEPFDDVGEIFAPSAEFAGKVAYTLGEPFYDFNSDSVRNNADGLWEGVNCKDTTGLCPPAGTGTSTGVGKYTCIVMSASDSEYLNGNVDNVATNFGNGTTTGGSGDVLTASPAASTVSVAVADINGNVPPSTTTITLDTSNLTGGTAVLQPSTSGTFTVGSTPCASSVTGWPARFTISFTVTTPPLAGSVGLLVSTPSGVVSELIIDL